MSDERKHPTDKQCGSSIADRQAALPLTNGEADKVTGGFIPPRTGCFLCPKCGKVFAGAHSFDAHVKTHL